MSASLSLAERIRQYVFRTLIQPAESDHSSAADIRVRAGDIHAAMGLIGRMPTVCSALESRKFEELSGCELSRREGPHRGSNTIFYFRRRSSRSVTQIVTTEPGVVRPRPPIGPSQPAAQLVPAPDPDSETIYLVSCVKSKTNSPVAARDLYTSSWFVKARSYLETTECRWFLLSARYGLLAPDAIVAPYELTLNRMGAADRLRWAHGVMDSIKNLQPRPSRVVMLAGQRYREHVEPALLALEIEVFVPMEGLRLGEQLNWLGEQSPQPTVAESNSNNLPRVAQPADVSHEHSSASQLNNRVEHIEHVTNRLDDLKRFYDLLGMLDRQNGGVRHLTDCDGRMDWPARGVYFFFEAGERRIDSGSGPRVVRVGTHALTNTSRTTLWKRLSQHRGTSRSGAGNHRGSIFRLLLGSAMKERDGESFPESWGVGSDPSAAAERLGRSADDVKNSEFDLECKVSAFVGVMPFLWLGVDDFPGSVSSRGYIERNSIALLSNFSGECIDQASEQWLGHHADRARVRSSGLWNNNHVDEDYDPGFLDRLKSLIASSV